MGKTLKSNNLTNEDALSSIVPLLSGLGWQGGSIELKKAMPYKLYTFCVDDLVKTLSNLGFSSKIQKIKLSAIKETQTPCAVFDNKGGLIIILKVSDEQMFVFDTEDKKYKQIKRSRSSVTMVCFDKLNSSAITADEKQVGWTNRLFGRFSSYFYALMIVTFVLAIMSILIPVFIMNIFGQASSGTSIQPLINIGYGVFFYLLAILVLTIYKNNLLNFVGHRVSYILDRQLLRRILYIPFAYNEKADATTQSAQVNDFGSVKDFILGSGASSVIEVPFQVVLIAVLFTIAGILGIIPICAMIVFFIFGKIVNNFVKKKDFKTTEVFTKKYNMLLEILSNHDAIKDSNSEDVWLARYKEITESALDATFKSSQINSFISNFTSLLVGVAGVLTISFGAIRVVNGEMTSGALIASMILTWRILGPLKSGFSLIAQVNKTKRSLQQVDRLMNIDLEIDKSFLSARRRTVVGDIEFSNVSFRYNNDGAPALLGVSFAAKNHKILQISGHEGCGKSTIIKLLTKVYTHQAGRILLDRVNISQFPPSHLRSSIGIASNTDGYVNETILTNMLLAKPDATIDEINEVFKRVGLEDSISKLENGLETVLNESFIMSTERSFKSKLNLAKAIIKNSPVMVFDNVNSYFSKDENDSFYKLLLELKFKKTVILISNDVIANKIADDVMVLDQGKVEFYGSRDQYLKFKNSR